MNISLSKYFPFLIWWPAVNPHSLRADALAGLTGAVIVLPQGVAFAMIAGMPPEYGLYTAIITPIIAALFGSSRHLISGPTTAISIVVFSAISKYAEPGSVQFIHLALTLTFIAGIMQLAFGLARLGTLVNFVSHSVVVGFTAGAAILIATSQFKHILGVEIPRGESFLETWVDIFKELGHTNLYVLAVALTTLIIAILLKKIIPRWPYMLIAMIIGSVLAWWLGAAAHGIKLVGELPPNLPPLSYPDLSLGTLRQLGTEAFAVALLGLIEAVSISRAIATRSQQRIDGNQEFIGQGLSNIVGSFFSSYAGSGSFTRSGINYQAGAMTPLAGIFAALFLAMILVFIAPLTAYLPIAAMGGIILLVSYNLIDFHHIQGIIRASRSETQVLLVTFLATLFLELEFAIYAGVMLSLFIYLRRTAKPRVFRLAPDPDDPKRHFVNLTRKHVQECQQITVVRVDGSVFFGAVNHISDSFYHIKQQDTAKHLVISGESINFIDVAGAEMLVQEAKVWRDQGGGLYFTKLKASVYQFLLRAKYLEQIGNDRFFSGKELAIAQLVPTLDPVKCATCQTRIFRECPVRHPD